MSSSLSTVSYNFNLTATRGDNSDSAYPVFTSACGMTGTTASAWVTRHETDEIQSEGNLATGVFI